MLVDIPSEVENCEASKYWRGVFGLATDVPDVSTKRLNVSKTETGVPNDTDQPDDADQMLYQILNFIGTSVRCSPFQELSSSGSAYVSPMRLYIYKDH